MRYALIIIFVIGINVLTNAQASLISGLSEVCGGSEIEYTYTGAGTTCNLEWTVFGGVFPGNFNQTRYVISKNATNKVKVKWDKSFNGSGYIKLIKGGCNTSEVVLDVIVRNFFPSISASKSSITQGETVTLTAAGTFITEYSWSCDQTSCNMSSRSGQQITVSPNITTTFTCTVKGNWGTLSCSDNVSVKITVTPKPATPDITGNAICCDQSICSGVVPNDLGQSSSTAIGGGNGTYGDQWQSSADGVNFTSISGAINASYTPSALTQNSWYRRLVTSGEKSSTSTVIKISVMPATLSILATTYTANAKQKASSSITINGNQTVVSNAQVDFVAGSLVVVSAESVLTPNINLKISPCISGQRILVENNEANEAVTSRLTGTENISYLSASPNPFDNETVIKYKVTQKGSVKLFVSDQRGKVIATLVDKNNHEAGEYEYSFNSSGLKGGVYLYTLQTNGHTEVKRLIINH